MSSPRYIWWPYVKGMIREYPALCRLMAETPDVNLTPVLTGMPGKREYARTTENAALRMRRTDPVVQKEYDAVRRAVESTRRMEDGRERLDVVRLVLWERTHTLEGAALAVHCSYRSARRWHAEFICVVAKHYGLL